MFFKSTTLEDLKREFRNLCKKFHPDKGGDTETFNSMKYEYENLLKNIDGVNASEEIEIDIEIFKFVEKLLKNLGDHEVKIEVTGKWIWITGNTFSCKDIIKEAGCKYSKGKKAWYWFNGIEKASRKRGRKSMNQIKEKFGVKEFTPESILKIGQA